jgi:hypothetical protein
MHLGGSAIRCFRRVENIERSIVPTPARCAGSENIVALAHSSPDCTLKLDRFDAFERI